MQHYETKFENWEDKFLRLYNRQPLHEMDEALYQCIQSILIL